MLLTFCLAACPLSGTGEGILCLSCTLCWLVFGESGQLASDWSSDVCSSDLLTFLEVIR